LIDLLTAFVVTKTFLQGPLSKKIDKKSCLCLQRDFKPSYFNIVLSNVLN